MTTVAELQTVLSLRSSDSEVLFDPYIPQLDQTHPTCSGTGYVDKDTRDGSCLGTGLIASAAETTKADSYVVLRDIVAAPVVGAAA